MNKNQLNRLIHYKKMNNYQKKELLKRELKKHKLDYVIQLASEPYSEYFKRVNEILNNHIRNELLLARLNKDIEKTNIENI